MDFVLAKNDELDRQRAMQRVVGYLSRLPLDKAFAVKVDEKKPLRTENQNSLLWALYTDIIRMGGEAMQGYEKEELHEFFLGNHFGWTIHSVFELKSRKPLRTSSGLNKQEFTDYIDSIVRFMANRGVVLTMPGDL